MINRIKRELHNFIDPYWKSGIIKRGQLYKELTDNTSMDDFHCALLNNQHQAITVYHEVVNYLVNRYGFIQTNILIHKQRYMFTHNSMRKIGTYDKRYHGFFVGGSETFLDCKESVKVNEVEYCIKTSIKSKRVPVGMRKLMYETR